MARTEVHATLKRIRRQLNSGHRSEVNLLSSAIDSSTGTVPLQFDPGAGVINGAVLSVDLEIMRVTGITGNNVSVLRGWLDSTAAAHSNAAEVMVNSRFTLLDIYEAMVAEINSWGPQMYRVLAAELTVAQDAQALALPAQFQGAYGLCRVARKFEGDVTRWPSHKVRLTRGPVGWSGAASSGLLLRFVDPVMTGTLLVTAAMPIYTAGPALTDNLVDDIGMPATMMDVLEAGVKLRLVQDGEWSRTSRQAQDDSRRAEETPQGAYVQPMQFGVALYRNRKQEEINKLRAQYPITVS